MLRFMYGVRHIHNFSNFMHVVYLSALHIHSNCYEYRELIVQKFMVSLLAQIKLSFFCILLTKCYYCFVVTILFYLIIYLVNICMRKAWTAIDIID